MDLDSSFLPSTPLPKKKNRLRKNSEKEPSKLSLQYYSLHSPAASPKVAYSPLVNRTPLSGQQTRKNVYNFAQNSGKLSSDMSTARKKPLNHEGKENVHNNESKLVVSESESSNCDLSHADKHGSKSLTDDQHKTNSATRHVSCNDKSVKTDDRLHLKEVCNMLTGMKLSNPSARHKSECNFENSSLKSKDTGVIHDRVIVISDSDDSKETIEDEEFSERKSNSSVSARRNFPPKEKTIIIESSDEEGSQDQSVHNSSSNKARERTSSFTYHSFRSVKSKSSHESIPQKSTYTPLSDTKCKHIQEWIDHGSPDAPSGSEKSTRSSKNSSVESPVVRLTDMKAVLDDIYGADWRSNEHSIWQVPRNTAKNITEGLQSSSGKSSLDSASSSTDKLSKRSKDSSTKQSVDASSDSGDNDSFDQFLQDMKNKFESTRKIPETPESDEDENFINDSETLDNDSPTFYIATHRKFQNQTSRDLRRNLLLNSPGSYLGSETPKFDKTPKFVSKRFPRIDSDDDDKSPNNVPQISEPIFQTPKQNVKVFADFPRGSGRIPKTEGPNRHVSRSHNNQVSTLYSPGLSFLASLSAETPNGRCHPEAQYFKKNFNKKKEELAAKLFQLYNTNIFDKKLPDDLSITWNSRLRKTAGYCYNKKVKKPSGEECNVARLELSSKVIDNPGRLRDTLIHELCHAATWIINGEKGGHGTLWKNWAKKAMRHYPELPPITVRHGYSIATKYTYRCTNCAYSIGRHSKSLDINKKVCGYCRGRFELLVNGKSTEGAKIPKTPNKFALFVKDNYGSVKKSKDKLSHKEVMKLLSDQFMATKI